MQQTNRVASVSEKDEFSLVKKFAIVASIITAVVIVMLIVPELRRDRWEVDNGTNVRNRLKEAQQLSPTDFMKAHEIYEAILTEASSHPITDESLRRLLNDAEMKKCELHPLMQRELARRLDERQRYDRQQRMEEQARIAEQQERDRRLAQDRLGLPLPPGTSPPYMRTSDPSTPYTRHMDSVDSDTRTATWANQFSRSEEWVKKHISPSDSAAEGTRKLTEARLREDW